VCIRVNIEHPRVRRNLLGYQALTQRSDRVRKLVLSTIAPPVRQAHLIRHDACSSGSTIAVTGARWEIRHYCVKEITHGRTSLAQCRHDHDGEESMQDPAITARVRTRASGAATTSLATSWLRESNPAAPRTISPEFVVVCLFSLLGLTLTAGALSYFSEETIRLMFSVIDWFCPNRPKRQTERTIMRTHHAIVLVAVMLIAFGVKLFFFATPAAEADTPTVSRIGMNIHEMHRSHSNIKNLKEQELHDMTMVFSVGDGWSDLIQKVRSTKLAALWSMSGSGTTLKSLGSGLL
jgi:hypothetical protein